MALCPMLILCPCKPTIFNHIHLLRHREESYSHECFYSKVVSIKRNCIIYGEVISLIHMQILE